MQAEITKVIGSTQIRIAHVSKPVQNWKSHNIGLLTLNFLLYKYKMVGWPHRLNGDEFEQTSGDSEGQGSLECCSPQGPKELDTLSD